MNPDMYYTMDQAMLIYSLVLPISFVLSSFAYYLYRRFKHV